jgi:hypothetical protein
MKKKKKKQKRKVIPGFPKDLILYYKSRYWGLMPEIWIFLGVRENLRFCTLSSTPECSDASWTSDLHSGRQA